MTVKRTAKRIRKKCGAKAPTEEKIEIETGPQHPARPTDAARCAEIGNTTNPSTHLDADSAARRADTELYRARLQLVGELLHAALRELASRKDRPDYLGKGMYLQVLGAVFDSLDGLAQGLSLDDLQKLSRIVAEQRRAESQLIRAVRTFPKKRTADPAAQDPESSTGQKPRRLTGVVEEMYGSRMTEEQEG